MKLFVLNILFSRKVKKFSDEELLAHYKKTEDLNHLGELFSRKTPLIASLCNKYLKNKEEAEDATFELFEVVKKDLLKHEVLNLNAWLFSVTRNHCYKKLNKAKKHRQTYIDDENNVESFMESLGSDDLSIKQEKEDQLNLMEASILELKEDQKICVNLFYIKQMSYQDISEQTGMELKTVKSHIQNGKRNLKIIMESKGNNV